MYKTCTKVRKRPDSECQRENVYLKHFETTGGYIDTTCPAYLARLRYVLLSKLFTFYSQFWINKDTTVFFSASLLTFICSTDIDTLQSTDTQRRSQDFQRGGGRFFIEKAKRGASEASVAYVCLCVLLELESLVGSGVKPRKTFHFLAFESPILRENWHPECFFSLWIFPIQWRFLWRLLWRRLRRHFCGDSLSNFSFSSSLYMILILFY